MSSVPTRGRVLVLGDSGVGKSSLVERICSGRVEEKSGGWTIGCNVLVKLCRGNGGYSDQGQGHGAGPGPGSVGGIAVGDGSDGGLKSFSAGDVYFMEFLDVGCHNVHHLSRSMYYHNVDAILLVYDVSNWKSFANLRKWVAELRACLKSPVAHGHAPDDVQAPPSSIYHRSLASVGLGAHDAGASARQRGQGSLTNKTIANLPVLVVGNMMDQLRGSGRAVPNVAKTLGFESVNVSATRPEPGDVDRIEQFLRQVVAARGTHNSFSMSLDSSGLV